MYGNRLVNEENSTKNYVRYLLAYHCMPTLLVGKPSSLVNVQIKDVCDRTMFLQTMEAEAGLFRCSCFILYENKDRMSLLIYQKEHLNETLTVLNNRQFLENLGYDLKENAGASALEVLQVRLEQYHNPSAGREDTVFPHEIGVVLGYPVRDVEAFIKFHGKNYLLSGYWKVYYDIEEALRIFESYYRLRQNSIQLLLAGKDLKGAKIITKM